MIEDELLKEEIHGEAFYNSNLFKDLKPAVEDRQDSPNGLHVRQQGSLAVYAHASDSDCELAQEATVVLSGLHVHPVYARDNNNTRRRASIESNEKRSDSRRYQRKRERFNTR